MNVRVLRSLAIGAVAVALMAAAAVPAIATSQRPVSEAMSGYMLGMRMADDLLNGSTFDGRCSAPSQWVSSSAGTGTMSHLGRVTWTTEHCFQLFAGTFGDAVLVITAANGDRLYGTYDGVMTRKVN